MRRIALFLLGAIALLTGCSPEQDEAVIGKWTDGYETFVFTPDGNYTTLIQKKGGTWKAFDGRLYRTVNDYTSECVYRVKSPSHLSVGPKSADDYTCTMVGDFWRVDLPDEDRKALISYSCDVRPQRLGVLTYTSPFMVAVGKADNLVCIGYTAEGCQLAGLGNVQPDMISLLRIYASKLGESYAVQRIDGNLRLTLMQSSQCERSACSFNGYIDLGACTRQAN